MFSIVGTIFSDEYLHFRKLPQAGMRRDGGGQTRGREMRWKAVAVISRGRTGGLTRQGHCKSGEIIKSERAE